MTMYRCVLCGKPVAPRSNAMTEPIDLEAIKRDHDVACDYHQLRMTISHRQRGQLIAEVERLRARVAELERDAARYRWLRDAPATKESEPIRSWLWNRPYGANMANLDDAIDAAMSEGER